MKYTHLLVAVCVASVLSVSSAHAMIIQTFGAGSAVTSVEATADFESTDALFGNPYTEGGMEFTRTNLSFNNNGCGFAGCPNHAGFYSGSTPFSGNYLYGNGSNGFYTISALSGDFQALEFISGTGNSGTGNQTFAWEAYDDGLLVGSGIDNISGPAIIGFSGGAFDELRYARSGSNDQGLGIGSGGGAAALDSVRAQFSASSTSVSEPGALGLALVGWLVVGFARRRA